MCSQDYKMMNNRETFYRNVMEELITDKTSSVLVCGGGQLDRDTLQNAGFVNATISNLDQRMSASEYAPYKWQSENAEKLSFSDASFDYVIVHAAIHHASSPHRVLTEMYRVAKSGLLAVESRDSLTMRLLEFCGLVQRYEHSAVYFNDCRYGGVNNSSIPNYVYRWTEREIEKTVNSYAPHRKHKFIYRYGTDIPCTPALEKHSTIRRLVLKTMQPLFWLFTRIFPKQQNLMAFYIDKTDSDDSIFPWLKIDKTNNTLHFDKGWGDKKYRSGQRDQGE